MKQIYAYWSTFIECPLAWPSSFMPIQVNFYWLWTMYFFLLWYRRMMLLAHTPSMGCWKCLVFGLMFCGALGTTHLDAPSINCRIICSTFTLNSSLFSTLIQVLDLVDQEGLAKGFIYQYIYLQRSLFFKACLGVPWGSTPQIPLGTPQCLVSLVFFFVFQVLHVYGSRS